MNRAEAGMLQFASLISGSSGNASFISDGHTKLLVDCGMSGSRLKNYLESIDVVPEEIDGLLITHEHVDHVAGAGVISRKYGIPIYATEQTHVQMKVGAVKEACIKIIKPLEAFEIGSIGICPFSIPHDAADPVGYNFFAGSRKATVATDIGHMNDDIFLQLQGSDLVLLEANHDVEMLKMGSYPYYLKQRILSDKGHLSNENAARTICELIQSGTKHIMLGHLSKENNHPDIAYKTAENMMLQHNIKIGNDATLTIAHRSEITLSACFA